MHDEVLLPGSFARKFTRQLLTSYSHTLVVHTLDDADVDLTEREVEDYALVAESGYTANLMVTAALIGSTPSEVDSLIKQALTLVTLDPDHEGLETGSEYVLAAVPVLADMLGLITPEAALLGHTIGEAIDEDDDDDEEVDE